MKKQLIAFLLLVASSAFGQVDVYVDLANFGLVSVTNRLVTILPKSTPTSYGGRIIINDERNILTSPTNGWFWVSNMVPGIYDLLVAGKVPTTYRVAFTNETGAIGADTNRVPAGTTATWRQSFDPPVTNGAHAWTRGNLIITTNGTR